ncbi:MAG: flavodoxin family protein [Candidatus Thorarchaeota archaeon]|jgi:flavodoxin
MTNVLVIYDSQFGNTKMLAEEIAAGIQEAGEITCKVENIKDLDKGEVAAFDAVLFGGPVHMMRATRGIQGAIKKAAKEGLDGKLVTTFETYMGNDDGKALKKMEELLAKKAPGARLVTPGFSALVDGFQGPLNAEDAVKGKEFGKAIGQELLKYS